MREILFRIANWFRGDSTWKYYQEYKVNQFYSLDEIKQKQLEKLKRLVEHAWNFEVYQKLWGEKPIIESLEDLNRLPPISKKDFKGYEHTFEGTKDSTSGSTGEPFDFYLDQEAIERKKARGRFSYDMAGLKFDDKLCVLWGLHNYDSFKGRMYRKFIQRTLDISALDMDDKSMLEYINKINKFRPNVIQAYTSAIYAFSQFLDKNKLKLDIKLNSIITSGETLTSVQREMIENVFGCRVINRYGSREFGCIAEECECGNMHVMEDLIVESKDGELLITNLENLAMPFIRYKIGDMGFVDHTTVKCLCDRGLPILKIIEGRVSEYIVSPSGKILSLHFLTLLFQDHKEINQFQIIQKSKNDLELLLVVDSLRLVDILQIESELKKEIDMNIRTRVVNEVELTKAGKRRLIIVENDR
jgi:phenylacetate-CoA ligase